MVMLPIQDLVASVAQLRCSFCIWKIAEVIVISLSHLWFYLSVIFNIEVKALDIYTEILDSSLWENFLQNTVLSWMGFLAMFVLTMRSNLGLEKSFQIFLFSMFLWKILISLVFIFTSFYLPMKTLSMGICLLNIRFLHCIHF